MALSAFCHWTKGKVDSIAAPVAATPAMSNSPAACTTASVVSGAKFVFDEWEEWPDDREARAYQSKGGLDRGP